MAPSLPMACPKCQGISEGTLQITGASRYVCRQCGNTWMVNGGLR